MSATSRRRAPWVTIAFLASAVAHVIFFVVLPAAAATREHRAPTLVEELELFVEIPALPEQIEEVAEVQPPVRQQEPPAARDPVVRDPLPSRDPPSRDPSETVATLDPQLPSTTAGTTTDAPTERPTETLINRDRPPVLDARTAARSVLETGGPVMPRAADTSTMDVETTAQRDQRLAANLDGTLRAATLARPEGFGRRVLPDPVRRPDGSLAYPLGQVTAIVNRDGTFTFDDTGGVDFEGMGNSERSGASVRWGLEEWMMRRNGADPHAATRRWFANQTESMRDEMMQRHMESQARAAARGMRGRMLRMLADESRTIADRKRAIFAQWDGCSEGETIGDAVRASIITVIREQLPESSPNAFTLGELDELNRRRESAAEFRPYAN